MGKIYINRHKDKSEHLECPERVNEAINLLIKENYSIEKSHNFEDIPCLKISEEIHSFKVKYTYHLSILSWIYLVHDYSLIKEIFEISQEGGGYIDSDTYITKNSFEVAIETVGTSLMAANAIGLKKEKVAFVMSRPPGHHAERSKSMGFCLFNNLAITARYLQIQYSFSKILVIDWDIHHGNGTQDIFYEENSIFFFDIHRSPFYPGTGSAHEKGQKEGKDKTLNIPVSKNISFEEYYQNFTGALDKILKIFRPEIILISSGFDNYKNDPLGGLNFTENDFSLLTKYILKISEKFCEGRIISFLEGGYDLKSLPYCIRSHVKALFKKKD